jgi:hypothetical protein
MKTLSQRINEGFESVNESYVKESDESSYNYVAAILKTLHSFSRKIKFRTEDVNGHYNIVYDDPDFLTQDILDKLRVRKLWNTGFAPSIGKFSNGRININFDKTTQDSLNIYNFDRKDWSPN